MRFPRIVERRFFPDQSVLTFPPAPRTHDLHGNLTFLLVGIQQESRRREYLMPPRTMQGNLTGRSTVQSLRCIHIDKKWIMPTFFGR